LWEATHHFIEGSISSFIVFFFLLLSKNQKYKNIFAETIRGTKNFKYNTGKNVTRFGQNVTRFCPTYEASQNFSKLN